MMRTMLCVCGILCLLLLTACGSGGGSKSAQKPGLLPSEEIALGGIYHAMSRYQVESIYGAPTSKTEPQEKKIGTVDTYTYGSSFVVTFGNGSVIAVQTNARDGSTTPAGIAVGDSEDKVLKAYGKPVKESEIDDTTHALYYFDEVRNFLIFGIRGKAVSHIIMCEDNYLENRFGK